MVVRNDVVYDSRVLRESGSLARKGNDVWIIGERSPSTLADERIEGIRIRRIRGNDMRTCRPFRRFQTFISFLNAMAILKADVYHCHDVDTLLLGFLASRWVKGKLVYDSHELWTHIEFQNNADRWKCFLLENIIVKKAKGIITVSHPIADKLQKIHHLKKRPCVLMNCPKYQKVTPSTRIRDAIKIPLDFSILYYHGRIDRNRDVEGLLAALCHIKGVVMVFLGFGPKSYLAGLKELVRELQLENRVYFLPAVHREEVLNWASSADLGIHLLGMEDSLNLRLSLGNKIFEYLMAGLPVAVPYFAKELEKIVVQWEVGITFDPRDPVAMACSFGEFLENSSLKGMMKVNALKLA